MILLLVALHCADDFHLSYEARLASVAPARTLAIAQVESRCNLNPRARGRRGEWGRFQIRRSTASKRCPKLDIRTYRGNVACHLQMFGDDVARYGLTDATVRHNGYGPAGAYAFLYKVLRAEERLTEWAPLPAVLDSAWRWAAACSAGAPGRREVPLASVHWRERPLGADRLAYWQSDTIVVDPLAAGSVWVLAHELVHHLLNGPHGNDAHPMNPFSFPCKLQVFQNTGGSIGLMGMHRGKVGT